MTTGKTKITSSGFLGGMFNGDFFKPQSIVSESDIADLNRFNEAIKSDIPYLTAIQQEMSNSSETARNLAKSAKGAVVDINAIPKASKAAAAGMKALSVAGNMLVNMGVAFVVTKLIEGIQWLATASERAKEAASELADELNAQKTTIEGNISTISGLEDEFKRLSKGVDDYGVNISLSAEEYQRYQQIVQQIVGISPSLISGYDKEGNAIANKNGLIEQSIALLKEENRQRIANATSEDTIRTLGVGKIEEYKDTLNDNQTHIGSALSYNGLINEMTDPGFFGSESSDEYKKGKWIADFFEIDESDFKQNYRGLEALINSVDFDEKIEELYGRASTATDIFTAEDLQKFKDYITQKNSLSLKLDTASKALNPTLQMVPQSLTVYDELTGKQKAFVSEYVNTFRITADTTEADLKEMRQDILDFTEAIGKASPQTKKAIEDLFSLDQTKMSATEWEKQVNDLINQIVNSLTFDSDEDKNNFVKALKIKLGIEFTTDGETTVDTMIDKVKGSLNGKFDKEIRKLKIDDLKILANLDISPDGIEKWSDVETLIANAKKAADNLAGSLNSLSSALTSAKNAFELFNDVEKDFNSTGAISTENINKILSKFPDLEDELYEYIMGLRSGASVMDLLKNKSGEMATMSDEAFKKMYMGSSTASKNIINHADNMFDAFGLGYQRELTIAENVNTKIIESNGTVCETFVTQWGTAVEKAGDIMQAFASGFSNLLTGTFFNGEYGIYKSSDGNWYNKSQYDDDGDGYLDTSNMTDVWMKKIQEQTPGLSDEEARNRANNTINSYANAAKKNNEKIAADNKEFLEKLKEYAYTSDDKTGSDKNEALDNYLKNAENLYKVHQDETKYINDLQWAQNNLVKTEKERLDITGKINEAYRDLADNRIKDIEHKIDLKKELYGEDYDATKEWSNIQTIAHNEANRLRAMGYDDNSNEIQDLQKKWWDVENSKIDFYTKQHENIIRDLEHARDMAIEKNPYADTTSYYKKMQIEYHNQADRLRALDPEKYKEDIQKLQQAWWSAQDSIVEWEWENSNRYIEKRNSKGDWALYGDSEYKAWERVAKWLREKYPDELDKIHEADQKAIDARYAHSTDWIAKRNAKGDWASYGDYEYKAWERVATWLRKEYPNELKKIQEADQKAIDARYQYSNDWIDKRNAYNDWELFGDSEVDAWGRVVDWLKADYPNELNKIKEAELNLFNAQKEEMERAISDIDDYIDARNTYNDWDAYGDSEVEAIQRQTDIIDNAYERRLISYEEYIDRLEEQNKRLYSLGQAQVDKHLSNIDKYISARNLYNDWDAFGDSETEAIKRQLKILDEAYRLNLISLEEYTEKTEEYTQKLYSVAKNNIVETISKLIEDYEEMKQDEKDALSFESSQYDSIKTLLQSYYDVTNAVTEAQHEINKELKASQSMYEYLNEETRELLFNQEDYNILSAELLDIQSAANALQKQYEEDILGATKEAIDEITSQYQMQYETMMKQYEIAKAELDVAKKRQKLDNVLAERNVRMFVGGQWQWVANTQNVIDAQNELAEAEIEREKQEVSLKQIESVNKLTEAQDDITTQINYLETDLEKVRDKWAKMQEMLSGESDEVAAVLKEISEVSSPELQRIIEATGGSVDSFSLSLSESVDTMSTIINTDFSEMTTGIGDIVTDLQTYSDAIKLLVDKINGIELNKNDDNTSEKISTSEIIALMKANSEKWHTASETERQALHEENVKLGASIGATYDGASGKWIYPTDSSSSGVSSSSSSSSSTATKLVQTAVDTIIKSSSSSSSSSSSKQVNTTDQYVNSGGTIQSNPNWDGKKKGGVGSFYKHADGTRYTPGGLTALGEEGFEAFITNNGRLIPINQPTIGNIGAGGVVFNREQMANLRNLWDLSNLGKVSPFVSSSNMTKQDTVIDNSIHINGVTISEQGNEDWINGLRRYVATHK